MIPDSCPFCHADLKDKPIPEESRHLFGGQEWFFRTVGIYDYGLDRTVAWQCPDCKRKWKRGAIAEEVP